MDMSNARDLSGLARPTVDPTTDPIVDLAAEATDTAHVPEEVTNLVPLAGVGTQLVNVVTEEGATLGMMLELAAPDGSVTRYLAPASGVEYVQKALNDFRVDLRRATHGEDVEIVDLVLGGGI